MARAGAVAGHSSAPSLEKRAGGALYDCFGIEKYPSGLFVWGWGFFGNMVRTWRSSPPHANPSPFPHIKKKKKKKKKKNLDPKRSLI